MPTRPHDNMLKAALLGMAGEAAKPAQSLTGASDASIRPPSRQGKRIISAYVSADAARQLRLLVADRDSTTQALIEEALNDLFRKYDRAAIA